MWGGALAVLVVTLIVALLAPDDPIPRAINYRLPIPILIFNLVLNDNDTDAGLLEPIVCGLDGPNNTTFIAAYDLIGAGVFADDFCVGGTCSESLYGMCESLYKPDLEADDLFEVISQALLSAINRDALSGWGAQVTIITAEGVTVKTLKARQD